MNVELKLDELDCEPFFHGYGPSCADKSLVFAIWKIPVTNLLETSFFIPFYVCEGNGPLLFGNLVYHLRKYSGETQTVSIPPNVGGMSEKHLLLPTYTYGEENKLRTMLNLVPSTYRSIKYFFSSARATQVLDSA